MKNTYKSIPIPERGGFTLVELLIVITIISMLVGLVVSFGWRFQQMARADRTRMAMKLAMNAVDYYYEATSLWPASFDPSSTPYDPVTLATYPPGYERFIYSDRLVRDLSYVKGSKERMKSMPAGTVKIVNVPRDSNDNNDDKWTLCIPVAPPNRNTSQQQALRAPTILDGWDRPMLYRFQGSMQRKPILISAGPDGLFGPRYYFYQKWPGSLGWRTTHGTNSNYALDDITTDQGM